jgi:hypothetical protein
MKIRLCRCTLIMSSDSSSWRQIMRNWNEDSPFVWRKEKSSHDRRWRYRVLFSFTLKRLNSFIHSFTRSWIVPSLKDPLTLAGKVFSFGFRVGGSNFEYNRFWPRLVQEPVKKRTGNVDCYHIRAYSMINQEVLSTPNVNIVCTLLT